VCINFCANIGKSATETLAVIRQAFGEESMSHTRVFEWRAQFRTSQKSLEDDQHTGRLISCATCNIVARLQQIIREDQRQTIQDLADEMGIGYGTFQQIQTAELGMHHVTAKFVPGF
jgi:NH3-dependent NAD+ synthetase